MSAGCIRDGTPEKAITPLDFCVVYQMRRFRVKGAAQDNGLAIPTRQPITGG